MVEMIEPRTVRLGRARVEANYERMRKSHQSRYAAWSRHNENLEQKTSREFPLPKLREFYARVDITAAEREALHVTRRAIESLTRHSFEGSQGEQVAEWSQVLASIGVNSERNSVVGQQSLDECLAILRENSYDIPLGVYRFVWTSSALQALERKYYLTDLLEF